MPVLSGIRLEIKAGQRSSLPVRTWSYPCALTMEVKVEERALVAPRKAHD